MSTLTSTQLQQQYIAYFGRPGDPAGIKYWLTPSSGISSAREFADKIYAQDEYKKTTIASKTTEEQVNSLYLNLFGRQADSAGLLYWTGEIQNGNLQLSNIAVNLIHAAQNPISANTAQGALDAKALENKVAAATAFTAELEKSTSAILAYQAESISPWVSGAAFASGVSFIKTATATSSTTTSDAASAVTTMIAASTASSVPDSKSLKLTANTDALVGDGGNDTISAVLQGDGATGTTVAPGDSVDGKAGTDTLSLSVAGALANGGYTISAVTLDNVEKLFLSNFDTNNNAGAVVTIEAGLMTGLTTVGLSASDANGDSKFNGLKNNVDAEMRNGSADLTLDYNGTYKTTGTADTQKLTLSAVTGGTFAVNGIETLNINTELVKSTLAAATSAGALKTVNVTGDQDLTINTALALAAKGSTVDASTFTGKLNVGLAASEVTVKGGTGADTFKFGSTLTTKDVVDGGAGADILTMTQVALDKQLTNVSNVETVAFDVVAAATGTAATMDVSKLPADVTSVQIDIEDTNDGNSVTTGLIKNLGSQTVIIKKSTPDGADGSNETDDGAKIVVTPATDTSADSVNVTLDAIGAHVNANYGLAEVDLGNYETINISNKKSSSVTANEVSTLTASLATSVAVTGDANLTLGNIVGGNLTSFDASALAGTLTATFDVSTNDKITAKAATKNTTFNFGTSLDNNDTVVGGAGTADKVTATFSNRTATSGKLSISGVETVSLTTSVANTIDLAGVTGLKNLEVTGGVNTIKGYDLATKLVTGVGSSVKLTAADATGTSDTLTLQSNLDSVGSNTVEAKNIENLAITVKDADGSAHTNTYVLTDFEGTSVTATQDSEGVNNTVITLGTLHKNVTNVDTSGMKAAQTFSVASATAATTLKASGVAQANITGSAKADTITISGKTAGTRHVIDGDTGTDSVSMTIDTGFVRPDGITNVETISLDVVPGNVDISLSHNFDSAVTGLTLTGGNSLSSFTTNTQKLNAAVKTFDASGFVGDLTLLVADDNFDDTLTVTGGSSTKDAVVNTIVTSTTDKPKTTGIETLKITASDGATTAKSAVIDLSNTTGVKTVEATVKDAETLTIDKATDQAVTVIELEDADSTVEYKLATSTGSSDAVTFTLKAGSAAAIADGALIKTTDIETVTINNSTRAEDISLANLSMATAGATMKLVATGTQALTVSALNADVTTIDASGMGTGGSFVQTGRSSTAAATYTGSDGNDTFQMKHEDDAIAAGAGTSDTLVISKNLILGGIKVDLSKTDDQVTTFNGNANTTATTGFENVDLTGITGSFGAEITAIKGGSVIAGTPNVDVITLGAGSDTISFTGVFSAASGAGKEDDITGWTSGSDKIGLDDDFTSDDTVVGLAAVPNASASEDAVGVGSGGFRIDLLQSTTATDIFILKTGDDANLVAAGGLGASADGTTLLKWLGASGNAATGIKTTAESDKFYIAAEDSGNTYLFNVQEGAGSAIAAAGDIAYLGVLTGTATTAGTDYTIVA